MDFAIVRETLKAQGSRIRWIPHPLMPADLMTKADPSTGNDALRHLLRTGKLVWDEETIRQSASLGRTKAVSRRQLETNDERCMELESWQSCILYEAAALRWKPSLCVEACEGDCRVTIKLHQLRHNVSHNGVFS